MIADEDTSAPFKLPTIVPQDTTSLAVKVTNEDTFAPTKFVAQDISGLVVRWLYVTGGKTSCALPLLFSLPIITLAS